MNGLSMDVGYFTKGEKKKVRCDLKYSKNVPMIVEQPEGYTAF